MITNGHPGREGTRDLVVGLAGAAAALALYVATLQPDFGGPEDTPKFQFIGYVLGIPHPPGYPLYVLLSHAFVSLPLGTIAYRANLFSAVMAAAACALAYSIGRQLGAHRWTSLCAALGLATGASFWRSAVFAEVYSLAAVMAGLTVALLLAWGARGGARRLVAAFGAFAFGLGNHLTIVGVVPAFAIYVLARDRRAVTVRMIAASAVVLCVAVAQYSLIVVRTHQRAPYLEIRADTAADLVGVITAERFADQRFAFGPRVLLTDHLPALAALIARELGAAGTVMFLAGAIVSVARADGALVLGAAAGMFAMVLNISGDLKGFITPLMVLLWPVAAIGIDAIARYAASIRGAGPIACRIVLAAAALLPAANLVANYKDADQSGHTEEGRFLRSLLRQLPAGARFIVEDYWSDMALDYFRFTGEAGPDRGISRLGFDAVEVRNASRERHPVFAFANAATFLSAEGLRFRRSPVGGPPLDQWLARLPRGSIVIGTMAYASAPPDLSVMGHANVRPPGRPRAFEAFAAVAHRPGAAWRRADDAVSFTVDAASIGAPLRAFTGAIVVSAATKGARIDVDGRTIAQVDAGVALAVFDPDGALVRALEFPAGEPLRVQYAEAVYELQGESACAELTTDRWTDVGVPLADGSWVTTMADVGSVVVDSTFPQSRDVRARSSLLLGDGSITTTVAHDTEGDMLSTTMTRAGDRRPVFRLALDRARADVRARLRPGGSRSSLTLCPHRPMRPLFDGAATTAALRPDFESEPYFGAGWGDAERSATGPLRHAEDGATLFLPLDAARSYRLSLDLASSSALELHVTMNGAQVGACDPHADHPCDVILPAARVRDGINTLGFALAAGVPRESPQQIFTFRGARIAMTERR